MIDRSTKRSIVKPIAAANPVEHPFCPSLTGQTAEEEAGSQIYRYLDPNLAMGISAVQLEHSQGPANCRRTAQPYKNMTYLSFVNLRQRAAMLQLQD